MADESEIEDEVPQKKGMGAKLWAIVGVLALLLAGGAFYAGQSGIVADLLPGGAKSTETAQGENADAVTEAFLELDPLMISVGGEGSIKQLRFRAYLQTPRSETGRLTELQPRILDVFATYLRALAVPTLEDPAALLRIRAQLLRRVQLLAGPESVQDLLIIDFVIT
ncbi:MAG: flagellar basal body-associated FliL family protein [Pseudomonadota bacterium]